MSYDIGDDMLVGDDVEDILAGDEIVGLDRWDVGAARKNARAVAMRRAQAGSLVRSSAPTKSRMYPLGLDSVAVIAAAATANVQNNPQVLFRPERIVVAGGIAGFFIMNSFTVGKNNQFVAAGAIPCDTFAPNSFGVRLKCDTAQVNSVVVANVTNIDGANHRFLATVLGEAVE